MGGFLFRLHKRYEYSWGHQTRFQAHWNAADHVPHYDSSEISVHIDLFWVFLPFHSHREIYVCMITPGRKKQLEIFLFLYMSAIRRRLSKLLFVVMLHLWCMLLVYDSRKPLPSLVQFVFTMYVEQRVNEMTGHEGETLARGDWYSGTL